ncbi:MAG: hypothetical protein MAG551_01287 [Candidatus Scalindua arabica]|uniref:Uncharacterized protein n=1 Tax=Candidatus Scalindua arabica TaxID=1127984 RepID=A0A941W309_9BACT|nr:hypothetical protein [Candidatus Scalindua arabica]
MNLVAASKRLVIIFFVEVGISLDRVFLSCHATDFIHIVDLKCKSEKVFAKRDKGEEQFKRFKQFK